MIAFKCVENTCKSNFCQNKYFSSYDICFSLQ